MLCDILDICMQYTITGKYFILHSRVSMCLSMVDEGLMSVVYINYIYGFRICGILLYILYVSLNIYIYMYINNDIPARFSTVLCGHISIPSQEMFYIFTTVHVPQVMHSQNGGEGCIFNIYL